MALSDEKILQEKAAGNIIIEPFQKEHLGTASYDVTLGKHFFAEQTPEQDPSDEVIVLDPGETILAHTQEFIGGRNTITTMMKARSSLGRNFIEVCKCAGWGDVGYTGRWTMEITNNSRHYSIPLVVGRRVAQIIFFATGEIRDTDYTDDGKYQTEDRLETLKENWHPKQMLPKMYEDREVTNNKITMEKQLQQRKEFNEAYECLTQESPKFPKKDIQELQEELIAEELEEFRQA
ncbi:MAG: hypothetical protein BRC25_02590, partial [Parcubacteria group bacterium SW_6_46_9]